MRGYIFETQIKILYRHLKLNNLHCHILSQKKRLSKGIPLLKYNFQYEKVLMMKLTKFFSYDFQINS
jgi:hypothetical protein